jgi:hypothetical protein
MALIQQDPKTFEIPCGIKSRGRTTSLRRSGFARAAYPAEPLHYNDYNIESGAKHQSSLLLLKRLISGWRSRHHSRYPGALECDKPQRAETRGDRSGNHRLQGAQTQGCNFGTRPDDGRRGSRTTGQSQRGQTAPPSPEALAAQADAYGKLFALFKKHRDAIDRITFWGLNDNRSWRRGQNPLVFDAANQPKPALQAIVNAVR